ncbi:GtrA family protein [Lactobacillus terrae]|uniref:GtrA family protein n=1 Tax=Lactobacillus terrae TaxID=2269374 RepID=UPI000C1B6C70|nr:GtrA family protein [Lactobacillus terrae]
MIEKYWEKYKDAIPYVVFGVLTTLLNIVLFGFLDKSLGWNYQIANVVAYFASVLFAYITNKLWVFKSHAPSFTELLREIFLFFLFRAGSWVFDQGTMTIGISLLHANAMITKVFANVIVIALNYIFSKFFIFRTKKKYDKEV